MHEPVPALVADLQPSAGFRQLRRTKLGDAAVILYVENGDIVEIKPNASWSESDIQALLEGNYGSRFK